MQNQLDLEFKKLNYCKIENDWLKCLEIAQTIEKDLLETPNSRYLLKCNLELFSIYYALGDLQKAFNYFALSEPLLLKYGNWDDYTLFMQNVVKSSFFYVRKEKIINFAEKLIPLAYENEAYEVLSHCYLLKSYASLDNKQVELAKQETKIAYFYSKFTEESQKEFVECNAKLQLVLTLIEAVQLEKAKHFIEEFNWREQECINKEQLLLVNAIEAMIALLEGNTAQGAFTYQKIMTVLAKSTEIMYSTILIRQMLSVLEKVKHDLVKEHYEKLKQLCLLVEKRFDLTKNVFMHRFETFEYSAINVFRQKLKKSTNIFEAGQKLFEKAIIYNYDITCNIFKMNYSHLSEQEKINFQDYIQNCRKDIVNKHFILTQLNSNLIVLIAISNSTCIEELEQNLQSQHAHFNEKITSLSYTPLNQKFANFYQLFNHLFFNELLELDMLEPSLA